MSDSGWFAILLCVIIICCFLGEMKDKETEQLRLQLEIMKMHTSGNNE